MAAKHTDDTAPKRVARHKMACKRWARAFCAVHTFADKLFFIITDKGAIRLPSYTDIAAELYPKRRKSVPEGIALSTQHAEGITLTRVDITRSGFRRAPGKQARRLQGAFFYAISRSPSTPPRGAPCDRR